MLSTLRLASPPSISSLCHRARTTFRRTMAHRTLDATDDLKCHTFAEITDPNASTVCWVVANELDRGRGSVATLLRHAAKHPNDAGLVRILASFVSHVGLSGGVRVADAIDVVTRMDVVCEDALMLVAAVDAEVKALPRDARTSCVGMRHLDQLARWTLRTRARPDTDELRRAAKHTTLSLVLHAARQMASDTLRGARNVVELLYHEVPDLCADGGETMEFDFSIYMLEHGLPTVDAGDRASFAEWCQTEVTWYAWMKIVLADMRMDEPDKAERFRRATRDVWSHVPPCDANVRASLYVIHAISSYNADLDRFCDGAALCARLASYTDEVLRATLRAEAPRAVDEDVDDLLHLFTLMVHPGTDAARGAVGAVEDSFCGDALAPCQETTRRALAEWLCANWCECDDLPREERLATMAPRLCAFADHASWWRVETLRYNRRLGVEFMAAGIDEFRCPITQELMQHPVVATDGHTYERAAIERWFAKTEAADDGVSPMTGKRIAKHLVDNINLRKRIANHDDDVMRMCRVHRVLV